MAQGRGDRRASMRCMKPGRNTPLLSRRDGLEGLAAVAAWAALPALAQAPSVTDGAGRRVTVPAKVERVFPAGPPAAIQLYTPIGCC